ncbi:MAG TPA: hypothetical protein VKE74_23225, partial [Gemmataceae bacterium]|nr:hypothetical protein [Gemmataceae bacterium]
PIGPGFMRVRFHDWFWAYRTRVEAFRSRAAGRFAFVQQHPFPLAGYHEVFFATCFKDGGLLITGGGSKVSNQTGNLVIRSWPTLDLYELEDGHQDAVEELIERGWQPDPDLSLETLLRATRENRHTRDAQIGCFILLGMVVVFQAGLVTLISVETGLWHWLPALAAIGVVAFVRTGGYMLQHNRAQELIRRAREARKGEPSD